MATTENLGLSLINSSDYVSPDPINTNMTTLDKLGIDYVVEKGTSGEWWYRKWKSGRAECGIDSKNFGSVEHTIQWGGMYRSNQLTFGAYPFSFSSVPFTAIVFQGTTGGIEHYSYTSQGSGKSTTLSPTFFLVDANSNTAENASFGIYVCGRYA